MRFDNITEPLDQRLADGLTRLARRGWRDRFAQPQVYGGRRRPILPIGPTLPVNRIIGVGGIVQAAQGRAGAGPRIPGL